MTSQLCKKLQLKAGQKALIMRAPDHYPKLLAPLPENVTISNAAVGSNDHVHLFVKNSEDLKTALAEISTFLLADTVFWIFYPKKSSGTDTDLNMMAAWEEPGNYGLRPVSSVSIDDTWTALRFKPIDQVKKSGLGKSEIQVSDMSKYLDFEHKIVRLPPDLKAELSIHAGLLSFFESLAWTHKKEYIVWILSAKQEKTRISRIQKAVEKLSAGKKNPNEK
jgi:hypothetical protein